MAAPCHFPPLFRAKRNHRLTCGRAGELLPQRAETPCVITNLGNEPFDGTVTFDLHALGSPAGKLAATVLDGAKVEMEDTKVQRTPVPLDGSIG